MLAPYAERAASALGLLEAYSQPHLRRSLHVAEGRVVAPRPDNTRREQMVALLAEHGLTLDGIELARARDPLINLRELDAVELYGLLCDWFDVVELGRPAGATAAQPGSWVHDAAPERACRFLRAVSGRSRSDDPGDREAAYALFRDAVDVELPQFTFGHLLRYAFFLRSEFAGAERFDLCALRQAGV